MPDQPTALRVLIIESGDDFRAIELPAEWDTGDIDRYLNGRAYGRAAVVTVEPMACPTCGESGPDVIDRVGDYGGDTFEARCGDEWHDDDPDDFLPTGGGEYGGGSV
jgi:hypothetical protein